VYKKTFACQTYLVSPISIVSESMFKLVKSTLMVIVLNNLPERIQPKHAQKWLSVQTSLISTTIKTNKICVTKLSEISDFKVIKFKTFVLT
jgi:hypothetical protein